MSPQEQDCPPSLDASDVISETTKPLSPPIEMAPLDVLFQNMAERYPQHPCLLDYTNREELNLPPAKQYNYAQANNIIDHLASEFHAYGYQPGDQIGIQLPNCCELPLIILGIMRAGLVPCLLPSLWRYEELSKAISKLNIRALIALGDIKDEQNTSLLFELMSSDISIRFLFGIGQNLPDGMTPFLIFDNEVDLTKTTVNLPHSRGLDHAAIISFTSTLEEEVQPLVFTHKQLLLNAGLHLKAHHLKLNGVLLSPFALGSLTGFLGAFGPWILRAGELVLTDDIQISELETIAFKKHIDYALLPASIINRWSAKPERIETISHYGFVWPINNKTAQQQLPVGQLKATNLFTIPGLMVLARTPEKGDNSGEIPTQINLFDQDMVSENNGTQAGEEEHSRQTSPLTLFQSRIHGAPQQAGLKNAVLSGELEVSGAGIPRDMNDELDLSQPIEARDQNVWHRTGHKAQIINQQMTSLKLLPSNDLISLGHYTLNAIELDRLYQSYGEFVDIAAFGLEDPLIGARLMAAIIPQPGKSPDYSAFIAYLKSLNISPVKLPEKLVSVPIIPRDEQGHVKRIDILSSL